MKKIKIIFIIIILISVSFYYTNKVVDSLKENDPIMKEIKQTSNNYNISPVNAQIIENTIVPGIYGEEIDYDSSFHQMKKYGTYNESMTTMKEIKPTISIEDNYDKYISKGTNKKRNISLIFTITNENINNILNILEKKEVPVTFFIDGVYLEKNINTISNIKNHEIELLSYNNTYEKPFFKTSLSYLESITNNKAKYCYTKEENEELLKLCKRLKLHTIKPTISIDKNIYKEIKHNNYNGMIISLNINKYVEKELPVVIDYLQSKGYKLVTLDNLLSEKVK